MKRFTAVICLIILLLLVPVGLEAADTEAPHLFSISPTSMANPGSVTITLSGSGFVPGATARMTPCNSPGYADGVVTVLSSQQATAKYSLSAGQWKVRLTNPDGDVTEVKYFTVGGSTTNPATTTPSGTTTTAQTTATTSPASSGKNSVFFETNPSGATIYFNGDNVGSSAFTYYTDRDGTFPVVVKKLGYQDYEDRVTVREGQRVRFYAKLEPISSTTGSVTATPATTGSSSPSTTPVSTVTTIRKSTLKMPTPLGTDPPLPAEESPADPSLALIAAGIAVMVFVIRRR